MVKLYPLFASGVLLRLGRRRALGYLLAVLVPFGLYAAFRLEDIRLAAEHMTRSTYLSWGAGVAPQALGLSGVAAIGLAVVGLAVAIVLGIWLGSRWRLQGDPEEAEVSRRDLDAFWIGSCVYVGTFLVGNNFDYKLVCLLFAVPQLLRWSRQDRPAVPYAGWALGALVALLWLGAALPVVPWLSDAWLWALAAFPFDEILTWFLFVYLLAALWATRPAWLAEPVTARLPRMVVREGR